MPRKTPRSPPPASAAEAGPLTGQEPSNIHVFHPQSDRRLEALAHTTDLLIAEAESGAAEAAYLLAWMYRTGTDVEANAEIATEWYRRAAAAGSALAQFSLGLLHIAGDGVPRNYGEALKWLSLATVTGDSKLSEECAPYILLLSIALGPKKTSEALHAAWHWQLSNR
jgi:TPR repeat protein